MSLQTFEIAARSEYVPADREVDFDMYNPLRVAPDFHAAWKRLQDSSPYNVVWTGRNGGHWIALRGRVLTDIYNDYGRFPATSF
jgi:hypothetical protein